MSDKDHDREALDGLFKKWGRSGASYRPLIESLLTTTWKTVNGTRSLEEVLDGYPDIRNNLPVSMVGEIENWRSQVIGPETWKGTGPSRGIVEVIANRQGTHGVFKENSVTTQNLKEEMRRSPNWTKMAEYQREALEMFAHKIGRITHGDPNFCDHWDDIAGYAERVSKTIKGDLSP